MGQAFFKTCELPDVADQILIGELSKEQKLSAESWAQ